MKRLVSLISVLFVSHSFAQNNSHTVSANIKGLGNDTVYIWYYPLSNINSMKRDTLIAKNDAFTYRLPINEGAALAIMPQKSFFKRTGGGLYMPSTKFIELFVFPSDEIQIKGNLSEYYLDYSMNGSKVNERVSQFRKTFKPSAMEAVKIELQIDSLKSSIAKREEVAGLFEKRSKLFNAILKTKVEYIDQHLDDDLSAYYLTRLPLETFSEYYPKLTKRVRNGIFSAVLKHTYQNYLNYGAANKAEKELVKGKPAPNFSLKGIDGKPVSLSNFKGRIIVLDFWGTWCGPCIQELPKLKSAYEKYKSKVNFMGIACNENEDDWRKAVAEHGLNWTQAINAGDNDVSVLYGVMAFPTKIIIDKELNIVKRFTGATEEFYQALDDLVK